MAGDLISGDVTAVLDAALCGPESWDGAVLEDCVSCGTPTHGRVGDTALHGSCAKALLAEQVGRGYERVLGELLAERFAAPVSHRQTRPGVTR